MNNGNLRSNHSRAMPNAYVLGALGWAIPMLIALYWPTYWAHPNRTSQLLRPAILGISALLAFICGWQRLSRAETKLAGILALVCGLWLTTAFAAVDIPRALEGWMKLVVLCLVAVFMSRAFRNPVIARAFGRGLIVASLVISAFIAYSYVRLMGWRMPTYESARQFKGIALWVGIPLNPIPFTAVAAFVNGTCLLPKSRFTWLLGAVLLYIGSAFTGSRAPLAVFVLTGLVLLIVKGICGRSMFPRFLALVVSAAMLVGTIFSLETVSFKKMSDITEGRWDLWYIALQKFSERPLLGWGFGSVDDDLYSREPGVYTLPGRRDGKFPGGYHNEYMGALAEEGLVGFIGVVALYWFLLRSCWQLAYRKWGTWHNGQWALAGGLILLIRAGVELPGLFGYANGPPDFQAYIFLAFVMSRFSLEEDFAKESLKHSRAATEPSLQPVAELAEETFVTQGAPVP